MLDRRSQASIFSFYPSSIFRSLDKTIKKRSGQYEYPCLSQQHKELSSTVSRRVLYIYLFLLQKSNELLSLNYYQLFNRRRINLNSDMYDGVLLFYYCYILDEKSAIDSCYSLFYSMFFHTFYVLTFNKWMHLFIISVRYLVHGSAVCKAKLVTF